MDRRDGDNSETKFIGVLFDGKAGIYLASSSAEVEAVELINTGIHE